jgi:DNA topoisomerase-1
MNLVIVESPAKCSKIQGFLGTGWRVIASMGHIRSLKEDIDAVGIDRDFDPIYEFMTRDKSKALKALKDAAEDAKTVYLAADDDREGEAIAYSVCLYLKLNPRTTPRAVFHEITERAVKKAVEEPRLLDMNRVNAQQARAMLDMMIGFTMSPLLWKHVARGLSAGRCQTPALRLVVERDDEISAFKGSSSWKISGNWSNEKDKFKFDADLSDQLEGEDDALNYLEMLYKEKEHEATVTSNTVKPWSSSPPPPLITSTLQQQASALYGCNPKNTMKIAQKLYEAGLITYMRTDKAVLSEEAKGEARAWVTENYGKEFVGPEVSVATAAAPAVANGGAGKEEKSKKGGKKKKADEPEAPQAQEAHEAIRPTHIEVTNITGEWTATDKKIYNLIWQRTVQSIMANATGETCSIRFQTNSDTELDFSWQSLWRRTLFLGWQRVGKVAELDEAEESEEDSGAAVWAKATKLTSGTKIVWASLKASPHESKAPGRFTEATLVRELEKHGIGRPSTFASLITAIQDKSYVETRDIEGKQVEIKTHTLSSTWPPTATVTKKTIGKEKQKLVPTDLGRSALKFMLAHFDDLFDYKFTAQMEQRLDAVSEGRDEWKDLLRDMWDSYKERYDELNDKAGSATGSSSKVRDFGGGLKAVMSKKGPLLLIEKEAPAAGGAGARKTKTKPESKEATFFGWPEGVGFADLTEEDAREFIARKEDARKPVFEWKGNPVVVAKGKFGPYAKCGDVTASIKEGATEEEIISALEAKVSTDTTKAAIKSYKEYEVRQGPYGPYITKTSVKQKKFVSLSASAFEKIDSFTEKDIADLYKAGLESKKKWEKK